MDPKIEEAPDENYQNPDHHIRNGCDGLVWPGGPSGAYATAQPGAEGFQ